jgi:hypothetical protein
MDCGSRVASLWLTLCLIPICPISGPLRVLYTGGGVHLVIISASEYLARRFKSVKAQSTADANPPPNPGSSLSTEDLPQVIADDFPTPARVQSAPTPQGRELNRRSRRR